MLRLYKIRLLCAFSVSLLVLPLAVAGEDYEWTAEDKAAFSDMPPPQPKPIVRLSEGSFEELLETDKDLSLFNPRHCAKNVSAHLTLSLWYEQATRNINDDLREDDKADEYRDRDQDSADIIGVLLRSGDPKKLVVLCDQYHTVQAIGEVSYVAPTHGFQARQTVPVGKGIHLHLLAAAPSDSKSGRASKGVGRAFIKLLVAQSLMQAGSGYITVEAYRGARSFYSRLGFVSALASQRDSSAVLYRHSGHSISMNLLPRAAEKLFADAFQRAQLDGFENGHGRVNDVNALTSSIAPNQFFHSAFSEPADVQMANDPKDVGGPINVTKVVGPKNGFKPDDAS